MKKVIAWILMLMMAVTAAGAWAEEGDSFFAQLDGLQWTFCSGVGAWSTDMQIFPDGSLNGDFHDADMGDMDDEYPNGTIYLCSFAGRLSLVGQVDENTWKVRVEELIEAESPADVEIEDGTRYIYTSTYGLSEGDEMLLYRPGTPVEGFTEDMQMWAHLSDNPEGVPAALETWFLYSEANGTGFVGIPAENGK